MLPELRIIKKMKIICSPLLKARYTQIAATVCIGLFAAVLCREFEMNP
jgi:hypothetical protein